MRIIRNIAIGLTLICTFASCDRIETLKEGVDNLEKKIAGLEAAVSAANKNAVALSAMLKDSILIVGVTRQDCSYTLELNDGTVVTITDGIKAGHTVPIIGIDKDGNWIISMDNGETFSKMEGCIGPQPEDSATPQIRISADGYWEYSHDGGETWISIKDDEGKPISAADGKEVAGVRTWFAEISYTEGDEFFCFTLADGREFSIPVVNGFYMNIKGYSDHSDIYRNETLDFHVESAGVAEAALIVPDGWKATLSDDMLSVKSPAEAENGEYEIGMILVSTQGYTRHLKMKFIVKDLDLIDFSYAGYRYGETAPPEVNTLGYQIYDITDYGAVPDDGLSDRAAFLSALEDALKVSGVIDGNNCISFEHKEKANAVIYFPEGEFILHTADDDVDGATQSILIRSGNFVIKGAGRDKTFIMMDAPAQPQDRNILYSSPDMIQIKHNSAFSSFSSPAFITEDSPKGAFSVKVSSAADLKADTWVCLHVKNNDPAFVAEEVAPYEPEPGWDIVENGVEVIEYHYIKSIKNNIVTFYEPIMHEVQAGAGWEIKKYPHYENVGIEDITFRGHAKGDFVHHGSWEDDGAYKPVSMTRVVNSWIRRVGFESVSEACSIISSANVSAYDIIMSGNRGHAAVRAQASSRVLIAATEDMTSDGAGNFHGVGVSRQSIGTVLWRNRWGDDSCFESHATQPRATLIDCCTGGWHRGHQGGDSNLAPHHLADLTIWNFTATRTGESGEFNWWKEAWWRILPPIVAGFDSGGTLTFNPEQTKIVIAMEERQTPVSLYEEQIARRLGSVPAWLVSLK